MARELQSKIERNPAATAATMRRAAADYFGRFGPEPEAAGGCAHVVDSGNCVEVE